MKIEKVSENQIRCTLTREDLADRHIKLSELAYGTEKAKSLFRDLMQQASYEFGFEAEDIPLMIEAVPLSADCIVLIVTKVEDPEELDTRFSKFAPLLRDESESTLDWGSAIREGADEILDLFKKYREDRQKKEAQTGTAKESAEHTPNVTKLYRFRQLDNLIDAAHVLDHFYNGYNTLYKNPDNGEYLLTLSQSSHTPVAFNKVCNILSEYGRSDKFTTAGEAYFKEHYEVMISDQALQNLALV
ncbi:adaptor protein MecA [Diplocloster agilis]|uniref:Adaptor protein MecA n=1 Tax=Diplocloster agilis TaxID=2850323 RepID=A0A949NFI2_9FIRM|nr:MULTISPECIES: adaptor protein MecA [Lachnospiraceae]MBU9738466.1 adaptor protein MecA [Diplocloster agilis]MBU9745037.1 adaptor protein MecA [Diplocloster agilis]MCU6735365.1 adaptor protein MecA [Suonthocola fibrivorans]SCJ71951.1 Adapter protein mecA 2 [uncultured Clostridium sp.]